jgi:hypothetical protein
VVKTDGGQINQTQLLPLLVVVVIVVAAAGLKMKNISKVNGTNKRKKITRI